MKQPQDWHLILASASPRRHSLLSAMGVECQVQASNVPEVLAPNETPAEYVGRLARSKAESILSKNKAKNTIVLAADTTVVMGDQILEKPIDFDDAVRMWELLSDRQHDVLTGVCVHSHRESAIRVVTTQVSMSKISSSAMRSYGTLESLATKQEPTPYKAEPALGFRLFRAVLAMWLGCLYLKPTSFSCRSASIGYSCALKLT